MDQNLPLKAQRVNKSGRKRITTPRTERQIRNICLPNRKMDAERLTTLINNDGIAILKRNVQRRLTEENLIDYRLTVKLCLTSSMMKKGLKLARAHQYWTVEDWNKVNEPCYDTKLKHD